MNPRILMRLVRLAPYATVFVGWAANAALAWWYGARKIKKETNPEKR